MKTLVKGKKWMRTVLWAFLLVLPFLSLPAGTVHAAGNMWAKKDGVCYNGSGKTIPGAITRGIDVSEWNGLINWKKAAGSNVDFAFIRVSYGLSKKDDYYDYNIRNATAAGLPVGVYIYSTARSFTSALAEAQYVIDAIDGYKISYPIVFDLEDPSMTSMSKAKIARIAKIFCDEIRKAGYTPMIYCNQKWYDNYIDWSIINDVDVWLARYNEKIRCPDKNLYRYTIWQASDGNAQSGLKSTAGLVAGISKSVNVDINFGFTDYAKKIRPRKHAVSSYTPSVEVPYHENGWVTQNGVRYYYLDGEYAKGWHKIGGKYYYFKSNGALKKKALIRSSRGNLYYVDKNGVRVKNKMVTVGGKTYYMGASGRAVKGLVWYDGSYYYFDDTAMTMVFSKKIVKGKKIYYAQADGTLVTSRFYTLKENGKKNVYYFGDSAEALLGLQKIDGIQYYFYKAGKNIGVRAKNTTIVSKYGNAYEFGSDGALVRRYKVS